MRQKFTARNSSSSVHIPRLTSPPPPHPPFTAGAFHQLVQQFVGPWHKFRHITFMHGFFSPPPPPPPPSPSFSLCCLHDFPFICPWCPSVRVSTLHSLTSAFVSPLFYNLSWRTNCSFICSGVISFLYCAQKETHIFNVAISNELFD